MGFLLELFRTRPISCLLIMSCRRRRRRRRRISVKCKSCLFRTHVRSPYLQNGKGIFPPGCKQSLCATTDPDELKATLKSVHIPASMLHLPSNKRASEGQKKGQKGFTPCWEGDKKSNHVSECKSLPSFPPSTGAVSIDTFGYLWIITRKAGPAGRAD